MRSLNIQILRSEVALIYAISILRLLELKLGVTADLRQQRVTNVLGDINMEKIVSCLAELPM